MDLIDLWRAIFIPMPGSLWNVPNGAYSNGFARNKPEESCHPGVIEKLDSTKTVANMIPGTSQKQNGSCVFKLKLSTNEKTSHFLIRFSHPINIDEIKTFSKWKEKEELIDEEMESFKTQIKLCRGYL